MSQFQNDIDDIAKSVADLTTRMVTSLYSDETITDDQRKFIASKNGLVIAAMPARVFIYALTGQEPTPDELRRFLTAAVDDWAAWKEQSHAARH